MYLGASLNFRGEWNILPQMPNILSLFALGIFPGVSARALAAPSKCSLWPGSGGPWASASKGVAVAGAALWGEPAQQSRDVLWACRRAGPST